MRKIILVILVLLLVGVLGWRFRDSSNTLPQAVVSQINTLNPLSIDYLKHQDYPGSDITVVETLNPGTNYQRFRVSYVSEGNKIFALLTLPTATPPAGGWPVIIFNHGYIPPSQYSTTERYLAYTDGFSRNGYVVFKPDLRGHGDSEGQPTGAYGSPGYSIDVLNAVTSIKKYPQVNPQKIGMWGHSMGGYLTLRSMVVKPDIKAGVIWGGVVGSYSDLILHWRRPGRTPLPSATPGSRRWRDELISQFGPPDGDNPFWNTISANNYLVDISGPVQLHHSTTDASVPVDFSQKLAQELEAQGKPVELYVYPGDDHNISKNFSQAMSRSIAFFDKYLKNN